MEYPKHIASLVEGAERDSGTFFKKYNPATGEMLATVSAVSESDVKSALAVSTRAFDEWRAIAVSERAGMLRDAALALRAQKEEIATLLALETGRSHKHARGEVEAAALCGLFFADEGERFQATLLPSSVSGRKVELRRDPVGVGALITPFNNPLAGIAWKLFPALLCGNAVVIKAHELTPHMPHTLVRLLYAAGVPKGVVTIIQGGRNVGELLVASPAIDFVSFTGSSAVGTAVIVATAPRLARVSIEAGGKNPFVVCDDADLDRAAEMAVAGSFVDAGQRCAATSRIIVFDTVYEKFKKLFLERVSALRVGVSDTDDYGAIISGERLEKIADAISKAKKDGATPVIEGRRSHGGGYFLTPTVFENVDPRADVSREEIFGPVVALYRARDLGEAVRLANDVPYRLSSAIHTRSQVRAEEFIRQYRGGVVRVNGPTHGSEPHMPFGGEGLSGNGWREPGIQALDFYSSLKQISVDPVV